MIGRRRRDARAVAQTEATRVAQTEAARAAQDGQPRVTLISRPGCHLCDEARIVIERVCGDTGQSWIEVSIDDDEQLRRRYAEEIPVTLVDGRQHDYWRVDEARLRAALGVR